MVLASLHHLCSWHFYWDYCHTSSSVQDKLSGTQMIGAIVSAICCPGQSSHHQEARCLYIYIKPECEYWGCQECIVTVKCWWHIQWWVREAEGQGDCRTCDTDTGVRPGDEDQGGPTKWLLLPVLDLQTKLQGIYYTSSVQSALFIPLKNRLIVTF